MSLKQRLSNNARIFGIRRGLNESVTITPRSTGVPSTIFALVRGLGSIKEDHDGVEGEVITEEFEVTIEANAEYGLPSLKEDDQIAIRGMNGTIKDGVESQLDMIKFRAEVKTVARTIPEGFRK